MHKQWAAGKDNAILWRVLKLCHSGESVATGNVASDDLVLKLIKTVLKPKNVFMICTE